MLRSISTCASTARGNPAYCNNLAAAVLTVVCLCVGIVLLGYFVEKEGRSYTRQLFGSP